MKVTFYGMADRNTTGYESKTDISAGTSGMVGNNDAVSEQI